MSTEPTIGDLLGMPEAAAVAYLDDGAGIAERLHDALTAAGARGSVRVLDDGRWVVRLLKGLSRERRAYPSAGQERDEWLSAMADRLEAAAGVRPEVETED